MQLRSLVGGYAETVDGACTLREAARLMSAGDIGSLLVAENDEIAGIITERDLMRAISLDADLDTDVVDAWMSDYPELAHENWDVGDAVDMMLEQGFRHLPVVAGNRPVGVVSIKDLVWAMRAMEQ